ncbi:MAG: nuclear transport factor 2 family protein [Legionella sp.]|nr:nuclear transport factor 2 family protein [Legionella sp.]
MNAYTAISNLLFKFANSFDTKDWEGLESTLMDTIECDYQDLRKETGHYTKAEYVNTRKKALSTLKTQHLFSNLEFYLDKKHPDCKLSAVIYRRNKADKAFDSHVMYHFELNESARKEWKIQKIKQVVLWNEGDASIHAGLK